MLTVREIKDILKQERISISKRRGQNFLVDAWAQKKIIEAIDIKPTDEILEIGPGLGALTQDLARHAGKVVAVEKDKALARILQQTLPEYKNLEVICGDILKFDIEKFTNEKVNPVRSKTPQASVSLKAGTSNGVKVVGNLPYYITTPIIGYLLEEQREQIKDIFITVQDEVGRRLLAKIGTKDYSALTIFVQYFTKGQLLFSIPKRAFYPQPKVDSVFIHLRIFKEPQVKVNNQEQFFKIVRACFNQRRKTILNSLAHKLGKLEKSKIQQWLTEGGINFQARPEELSIEEFARIEALFFKRGHKLWS